METELNEAKMQIEDFKKQIEEMRKFSEASTSSKKDKQTLVSTMVTKVSFYGMCCTSTAANLDKRTTSNLHCTEDNKVQVQSTSPERCYIQYNHKYVQQPIKLTIPPIPSSSTSKKNRFFKRNKTCYNRPVMEKKNDNVSDPYKYPSDTE